MKITAISKRKKDGIFIRLNITTYIVENTLANYIDKKNELDINEEDFYDKRRQKATSKKLLDKLETYGSG